MNRTHAFALVSAFAMGFSLSPRELSAQVTPAGSSRETVVTALSIGTTTVTSANQILVRARGSHAESALTRGQRLSRGSTIRSQLADAIVGLECPDASVVRLSGAFQVVIADNVPSGDCVIELTRGRVDVQTRSDRSAVRFGAITLATTGTQYGFSAEAQSAFVLDGSTEIVTPNGLRSLGSGRRVAFAQGVEVPLSDREITVSAQLYARAEVAQSTLAAQAAKNAVNQVTQLYRNVFGNPGSPDARVALASAQLRLGLPPTSALYQADRVEEMQPGRADAALLRARALQRMPGQGNAAAQALGQAQARAGGQQGIAALEARLGIAAGGGAGPLTITAGYYRGTPPGRQPAQCASWYEVRVEANGRGVSGATVVLEQTNGSLSQDGTFPATSKLRLTTDSSGAAYYVWFPSREGPATLTVDANAPGYTGARTQFSANVGAMGC